MPAAGDRRRFRLAPAGATMAPTGTKKELIRKTLEETYPRQVVPSGGFAALARTIGASRALVSSVASELGYTPATQRARRPNPSGCKHCGRETEPGKRMCAQCAVLTLTCDCCGRAFKRPRDRVMERERDPRYHGGIYCSRRCYFRRNDQ